MGQSQKLAYMLVGIVVILGVYFSLGKIRYAINPLNRAILRNTYVRMVIQKKQIDPEDFWKFRDFYAATSSIYAPNNIPDGKPFLSFNTKTIQSDDYLLPSSQIFLPKYDKGAKVLFSGDREKIYQTDNVLYITFSKPLGEMLKANGFFGYFGFDTTPYQNYHWVSITSIPL